MTEKELIEFYYTGSPSATSLATENGVYTILGGKVFMPLEDARELVKEGIIVFVHPSEKDTVTP